MIVETQDWILRDRDENPVCLGQTATSFRGEEYTVSGGFVPSHEPSTGRVVVSDGYNTMSYYPSVFGFKWEKKNASTDP